MQLVASSSKAEGSTSVGATRKKSGKEAVEDSTVESTDGDEDA